MRNCPFGLMLLRIYLMWENICKDLLPQLRTIARLLREQIQKLMGFVKDPVGVTEEEGHSGEGEKREGGSARFVRREDGRGEGEEPPMWRAVVTGRWSVCGSQ